MRFAGLSAATPFAVALVVVDGFAPRGAIVLSLAAPELVEGVVVAAPAAAGPAAGAAGVDGIADVAAPVVGVDVSAAFAAPIANKPMAEAITA